MDSDGSNKTRLTRNGATNWAPSWHPDGKRIIFSSNMDDWHEDIRKFGHNFELYMINIDGTGLERITYNNTFDSFPCSRRMERSSRSAPTEIPKSLALRTYSSQTGLNEAHGA